MCFCLSKGPEGLVGVQVPTGVPKNKEGGRHP